MRVKINQLIPVIFPPGAGGHFFYNLLSKVVQGEEAGFQRAAATSWMGRVVLVCEEKLSYELNGILVHPILKNHIF